MRAEGPKIDWTTVQVSGEGGTLVFRVELTDSPDEYWEAEFNSLRESQTEEIAGSPLLDFWINRLAGRSISGGGFAEAAVPVVRRTLDDLVDFSTTRARNTRQAVQKKEQEDNARAEELSRSAERAAELFRMTQD